MFPYRIKDCHLQTFYNERQTAITIESLNQTCKHKDTCQKLHLAANVHINLLIELFAVYSLQSVICMPSTLAVAATSINLNSIHCGVMSQ